MDTFWKVPQPDLQLKDNELHIWYTDLNISGEQVNKALTFLSRDEKARASRYVFPSDKYKFVAGRAVLRLLLGKYFNASPEQFEFSYTFYGKPSLSKPAAKYNSDFTQLKFNLSHSDNKAVYAFTTCTDIGIDIEKIREGFDEMELAGKFFSADEVEALKLMPESQRKRAFFNCWSRKEAFIKAKGEGLSMRLDSFSVPILPFYSDELLSIRTNNLEEGDTWKLKTLKVDENFSAAAAVKNDYSDVKCWWLQAEEEIRKTSCHFAVY